MKTAPNTTDPLPPDSTEPPRKKGLIVTVPGQPSYVLVPQRGTSFNLAGMTGFSVEFRHDSAGAVTEVVFHQPNGTFVAHRK